MTNDNDVRPRSTARRLMGVGGLVVAVAMISATTAVWASHTFNDVPDSHPFHDQIAAVTDACIAGGFPDDTYRPGDEVTRQAMAAFLERTGSRVEQNNQAGSQNFGVATGTTFSPRQQLTQVTVDAPDLTGCNQWALVQGRANLFTNSTTANACHTTQACNGHLWLEHGGSDIGGGFQRITSDYAGGTVTVQALVPLTGGTGAQTFTLSASGFNVKEGAGLANGGALSVTIVPFS